MGTEKAILCNNQDSNLSEYEYDMVVATTQKSINATMKEYLYNLDAEEFISCYVSEYNEEDETVSIIEGNYKDIVTASGGIDLFLIPVDPASRTKEQKEAINKAYDNCFCFAFKAKMGIASEMSPLSIPNIIEFIESDSTSIANVKYKAFYEEFHIIEIKAVQGVPGKVVLTHVSQDDIKPWIFEYTVKLDLQGTDFKKLPKEVQDKLKSVNNVSNSINPDTMFSIQQLYLDLNTTALQSYPSIDGIDASDDAIRLIKDVFINKYFNKLKENDDVIFGYTVARKDEISVETLISPTDFNFYISPYYDKAGNIQPDKQELYTLNYLVMCNKRQLPKKIEAFKWNWVTEDESSDIHGVMSINRSNIIELLKNRFTPILKSLILKAYAKIYVNYIGFEFKFALSPDDNYVPEYVLNTNADSDEILNFSYHSKDSSSDNFFSYWGNITLEYEVESKIEIKGDNIKCTTNIVSNLHVNVQGGVSKGTITDCTLTNDIAIRVDANGQIYFDGKPLKDTENKTTFSISGWSNFATAGDIKDYVNSIKSCVNSAINNAKSNFECDMQNVLKNSTNWVFPGGKTFTFKNPAFSKHQDLTVDIIYVKPDDN